MTEDNGGLLGNDTVVLFGQSGQVMVKDIVPKTIDELLNFGMECQLWSLGEFPWKFLGYENLLKNLIEDEWLTKIDNRGVFQSAEALEEQVFLGYGR